MKKKSVAKGLVFCILAAVFLLGGMAMRSEAGSLKLSMADFTTDGSILNAPTDLGFLKDISTGYIAGTVSSGDGAVLIAPVKFTSIVPAKLKNVTLYVVANNPSYNLSAKLIGVDMTTGDFLIIGEGSTSGASITLQELVLTNLQKLNKTYQYYLVVYIYLNQYLYGAQVNW